MDPLNPFTFTAGNATSVSKRNVVSDSVHDMLEAMSRYNKKGRRSLFSV